MRTRLMDENGHDDEEFQSLLHQGMRTRAALINTIPPFRFYPFFIRECARAERRPCNLAQQFVSIPSSSGNAHARYRRKITMKRMVSIPSSSGNAHAHLNATT